MMEEHSLQYDSYTEEWEAVKKDAAAFLKEAATLTEVLEMDKSCLGAVYKTAYDAFSLENYGEAENLFTSLFLFDAREPDYQAGYAASLEAQEKFRQAISIYTLMLAKDESARIYYRMGKCFFGLEDRDRAALMFDLASKTGAAGVNVVEKIHIEKSKKMAELLKG